MKNLLKDTHRSPLYGRTKYTVNRFVSKIDIINKCILNIGCGYGWFEYWAINNGAKFVTGIEPNLTDLSTAMKFDHPQVKFVIGDALKLPFENDSFDTVVCWEVLEHIPKNNEWLMFQEVNRVLKKNGKFYLSTPNRSFLSCVLDPAWWLIGHRHYSQLNLESLAKQTSLKIDKMIIRGSVYEMFGMINLYICKWVLRREMIAKQWFCNKVNVEYLHSNRGFATIFMKFTHAQ